MDRAREALLRAEVAAAQTRLQSIKDAWCQLRDVDPSNRNRLEYLAQSIGDAEDLVRGAERALHAFLAPA